MGKERTGILATAELVDEDGRTCVQKGPRRRFARPV